MAYVKKNKPTKTTISNCLTCSKEFKFQNCRPRKYCSRSCLYLKQCKQNTCIECGVLFSGVRFGGLQYRTGKFFCSDECKKKPVDRQKDETRKRKEEKRVAFAKPVFNRICEICRCEFQTNSETKLYCKNSECRNKFNSLPDQTYQCLWCDVSFIGKGNRKFCAQKCSRKHWKKANDYGSSKTHRQRARRFNCEYVEFNKIDVFIRDKWQCQVCFKSTPQSLQGSLDDDAPELDHIKPMSDGGSHTPENTQCLCRRCNSLKSNYDPMEFLKAWEMAKAEGIVQ